MFNFGFPNLLVLCKWTFHESNLASFQEEALRCTLDENHPKMSQYELLILVTRFENFLPTVFLRSSVESPASQRKSMK